MENQLNSGSLDTLILGQTLLVSARKVSGDKIHLEFAEIINQQTNTSVVGEFNRSDVNFSSKARRAWVTAEPVDATDLLGVDFGPTASWRMTDRGEMLDLDILNPTLKGERVQMLIKETTEPTEYQKANIETTCKRRGKNGDPITHQGAYIFSNTTVVRMSKFKGHTELVADTQTDLVSEPETELASMI
tara:strand:- start:612 stop:1178 length:567 start_codon:yes stop_codon:yes gene_type:complete